MELWLPFPTFHNYEISSQGRVRRLDNKRLLNPKPNSGGGYYRVRLCESGVTYSKSIHRAVAIAFIPNTNNHKEVNHKDGNKNNNFKDNLEWTTCLLNKNHHMRSNLKLKRYGICKVNNVYRVSIRFNRQMINLGYYKDMEVAYEVFYNKYFELRGIYPW